MRGQQLRHTKHHINLTTSLISEGPKQMQTKNIIQKKGIRHNFKGVRTHFPPILLRLNFIYSYTFETMKKKIKTTIYLETTFYPSLQIHSSQSLLCLLLSPPPHSITSASATLKHRFTAVLLQSSSDRCTPSSPTTPILFTAANSGSFSIPFTSNH